MSTMTRFITAEEYAQLPLSGSLTELVRGEIVELNQPYPRHGQVCARIIRLVGDFAEAQSLGHVISNDSGILTGRDPDTVRGGDVWFVSYRKVPQGPLPQGYLKVPPELVFEVKSPTDRWSQILAKVAEYLDIGVEVVCVVDPDEEMVRLYYSEQPEVILAGEELVRFPQQLPGFEESAQQFFA